MLKQSMVNVSQKRDHIFLGTTHGQKHTICALTQDRAGKSCCNTLIQV